MTDWSQPPAPQNPFPSLEPTSSAQPEGPRSFPPPQQQPQPNDKPLGRAGVTMLALFVGLAAGVGGAILADNAGWTNGDTVIDGTTISPVVTSAVDPNDPSVGDSPVAKVANAMADSVVTISAVVDEGFGPGESVGSGVVLSASGEILTNAHVVDGAQEVRVRFAGETEPRTARVVATDTGNDLALLRIAATGLKPATFAQPNTVRIGDEVVAIGYALDLDGGPTVTDGIISALNRTIVTDSGALNRLIQTDAAISSGNSGGPLVNMRAEVVGINTAVARGDASSAANNVGFAISVEEILRVVDQLRSQASGSQRVEGYLGVSVDRRDDGGQGAVIMSVQPNSPASRAEIREGDVVLSVDGEPIDGQAGLVAAIRDCEPGQTVEIQLSRDGERVTVMATLEARAD